LRALNAVDMKVALLSVTSCSLVELYGHLIVTCHLHLDIYATCIRSEK